MKKKNGEPIGDEKKSSDPQIKVHDSGYKKLFSNRTIFQQLLETFINEAWVKELDFSKCETLEKSFVADHYKSTESDLIYKVKLRGKTVYIYLLLEFQSTVDRFMVIRVLYYILSFYMDYRMNYKRVSKLPAIFPIVLYNGKKKWSATTKIEDLIESEPPLGDYAIHFQHLLLNERAYGKEQLLKIRNIVSTLFLAEGQYDIKVLEKELTSLYVRETDKQAVSLFLNWFKQLALHGKISPDDYEKLDYVYRSKEEVQSMLVEALQQEKKKIFRAGEESGYLSGEAAGIIKTLVLLIRHRFQISEAEQATLLQQLHQIQDVQVLTNLTNHGLDAVDFVAFQTQLGKHLPTAKREDNHQETPSPLAAQS